MKANFKSIVTTFKKLFTAKPKNITPVIGKEDKILVPEKQYNKTGISVFHYDLNKQNCFDNKVNRRRNKNKMARHSRQINRKAA